LLRVAAADKSDSHSSVFLSGEAGTLASSLDAIFYKDSYWLTDLFGSDERGVSNARRIFPRTNPGRRKPGPVEFGLNRKIIAHGTVSVYLDEVLVCSEKAAAFGDILENCSVQRTKLSRQVASSREVFPLSSLCQRYQYLSGLQTSSYNSSC
jgi:hypothetical protein